MSSEIPPTIPARAFRQCARCQQPTPAQLPQCVHCGARSLQAVAGVQETQRDERFIRSFFARATPITQAILLFNIFIYVLMAAAAGHHFFRHLLVPADRLTLLAFGAKTNELLHRGEYFRLVTPIFIHIGILHLVMNSYALWTTGPIVERLYGSARFLLIYLLAGIGGVAGSYLGHRTGVSQSIPSAGASGAIFGMFGVLAVFGWKYRAELPQAFRRAFGAGVLPVIAINLLFGFSIPYIDNSAHIGGLVTGAVLALLVPYIRPGSERVSKSGLLILAICLAMIVWSFARAWQTSVRYLPQRVQSVSSQPAT